MVKEDCRAVEIIFVLHIYRFAYLVWLVLGKRGSKGAVSNLVADITAAGMSARAQIMIGKLFKLKCTKFYVLHKTINNIRTGV